MGGRIGGIMKTVCGGQNWWECEDGVGGSVGGIVKTVCVAELVGL